MPRVAAVGAVGALERVLDKAAVVNRVDERRRHEVSPRLLDLVEDHDGPDRRRGGSRAAPLALLAPLAMRAGKERGERAFSLDAARRRDELPEVFVGAVVLRRRTGRAYAGLGVRLSRTRPVAVEAAAAEEAGPAEAEAAAGSCMANLR